MFAPCVLLGAAAAALLLSLSAATAPLNSSAVSLDGWYACELDGVSASSTSRASSRSGAAAAQCAIFQAPLCHTGVCSSGATARQIDVFVKRITASTAQNASNLIMTQGVAGATSLSLEAAMQTVHAALGGRVNVYTIDNRGTGRGTTLDCVAAQAQTSNSPGGTSISADEVASCADELQSRYPSEFAAFSLTSAAMDIQYFVTNFLNGSSIFVYGVGHGSSVIERLMHLNAPQISGYVLDGVSTTSGAREDEFAFQSKWDVAYDAVGQYVLSLCADSSAACGKFFPNATAAETLRSLVADIESSPSASVCSAALDVQLAAVFDFSPGDYAPAMAFRWAMGELLRRAELRKFIPIITYRLARCSTDDAKALAHFFSVLSTAVHASLTQDSSRSNLLRKMIAFSEFWESPTPSTETMAARLRNTTITTTSYSVKSYCAFTKDNSSVCDAYANFSSYAAAPLVYAKDAYWNVAARPLTNASVLLLSSKMDSQTPHRHAESLYEALDTTNKALVAFASATHGALWSTPLSSNTANVSNTCGVAILASYVGEHGDLARTNTSCVATLPPFNFTVESRLVATWLNTSAAYDGKFVKSTSQLASAISSPYQLLFIALGVLLLLALVSSCVLLAKWRHAKKRRATFSVDDPVYNACTH